jgi:peptidoglycan-associated lipoprotein
MKKVLVLLMVVMVMVAFGCKQRVVTKPDTDTKGDVSATDTTGKDRADRISPDAISSKDLAEAERLFKDVFFDFDKYNIKSEFKSTLKAGSSWMLKHSSASLSIEGHCDERGTNEYNLALGDRRANAVKEYLVSLGVPSSRLQTLSYGEEKPQCAAQNESCWSQNRRAHFVILTGK